MPSHPTWWRSILILSSHLRLDLPSVFFLSGRTTKILYALLLFPVSTICSTHLILLELITWKLFDVQYTAYSALLSSIFHSPATSFLLGPNIFLSTQWRTEGRVGVFKQPPPPKFRRYSKIVPNSTKYVKTVKNCWI